MAPDSTASASKIVGVPTFKKPVIVDDAVGDQQLLVLEGVRCHLPYLVKVVAPAEARDQIQKAIDSVFSITEERFSNFRDDSEVSNINAMPKDQVHEMSPEFTEIMREIESLIRVTGGKYDPAVRPLAEHFKQAPADEDPRVWLASEEGQAAMTYSKYSAFQVFGTRLSKLHAGAKLDMGGIAKGWAVDQIVDAVTALGYGDCYVDWGADIKVGGRHPSGRLWSVAVVEPPALCDVGKEDFKKDYLMVMELKPGQAIATSGDYLQVKDKNGEKFHHIIDPVKQQWLRPSDKNVAQASVVSTSCMVSDALATACLAVADVRTSRLLLDRCRAYHVPVKDYLIYARHGPRIVPMKDPAKEDKSAREERLGNHLPGAHVIVVGGGLAGCCATIEAAKAGAKVTLIEKENRLGGNSAKATSGINGWGTDVQAKQGIDDHERFFERDVFRSGVGGLCDPSLVRTLSTKSAEAIHWLIEELNVPLSVLSQLGGHSRKRTHRAPPKEDGTPVPIGYTIMSMMREYIETSLAEQVTVMCSTSVSRLLWNVDDESGRKSVHGVVYKRDGTETELQSDAVVLTTGGFGCDYTPSGLIRRHRPDLAGVPTTNGHFATGDGMKMCEDIGAALVDMDKVQLHPTSFIDPKDPHNPTKYLGPEALRGSGGILVNQKGERFVNELDLRSRVSAAILNKCEPYVAEDGSKGPAFAWCILNQNAQDLFGRPSLNFYKNRLGLFEGAADIDELAKVIGCDTETLRKTFADYEKAAALGVDAATGKSSFPTTFSPDDKDLVVARVTPSIHYTMGGVRITASGEVQETIERSVFGKKRPIRRLFAAGEVTGGVHGANRLGGNSLLECVVFGRLAGERAACINQRTGECLKREEWVPVTLREMRVTDEKYGINTRVFRFNFHGAMQTSGMNVGQFLAIRGDMDGETLLGYYSPITRPDDEGVVDILCRTDNKGGSVVDLLQFIRPGSAVYLKAMGGLQLRFEGGKVLRGDKEIRKIGLLAGGTGIAPMIQIIRAFIRHEVIEAGPGVGVGAGEVGGNALRLVYAADTVYDLAFAQMLEEIRSKFPGVFNFYRVLNNPPLGWYEGVGFVVDSTIKKHMFYPPSEDMLIVICGPPIFERAMSNLLSSLGYHPDSYYFFSQDN